MTTMLYFKTMMPVPNKGEAWTFYECDDQKTVLRQMTYFTGTGEIERIADPIVKQLYRPEVLTEADPAEFLERWGE